MMVWRVVRLLFVIGGILLSPVGGYAQEAVVSGTVTDETGGVMPGVSITALHEATGNTFLSVTDERGDYRIQVRIGTYRVTAELTGFGRLARTIELQVGQNGVVNLQLRPSTLEESVTVTGEAPLVNITSSTVGANIDARQMADIPLQGRNWMDLALLAPGVRSIEGGQGVPDTRQGYSQINVDGQQVTFLLAGTEAQQPKYSRDSIAEFEIISNRFDASQGRSAGFAVNAVTKSGTNTNSGTVSGYFRDDSLNAADFIRGVVLPYNNQQIATTFGGPLVRDRLHYFGNYEFEREPRTLVYSHPLFPMDIPVNRTQHTTILRVDMQFTPSTRLSSRVQGYREIYWGSGSATSHPASASENVRSGSQVQNVFTHVISDRSVNALQVGWSTFTKGNQPPFLKWKGACNPNTPYIMDQLCGGSISVQFAGLSIGSSTTGLRAIQQSTQIRNDFTTSFNKGGRQDIKMGAEFMHVPNILKWPNTALHSITLRNNTPPPANIQELFPVWNDVSTWNFAALSPLTVRVNQNISKSNFTYFPWTNIGALWVQDDWQVSPRLTVNFGMRYDIQVGAYSEKLAWEPWKPGDLPYDKNNFAPRTGVVFNVNDRMVIRGGYGLFFTQSTTDEAHQTLSNTLILRAETQNDGRADFAANPYNGPMLTYDQALARSCDQNGVAPGCLRRGTATGQINLKWQEQAYAHQASVGLQRQIGSLIGIDVDVTYTGGRGEERSYDLNRTFDRATGNANDTGIIALRAFPNWSSISGTFRERWSNYYSLQTTAKKRMSSHWQGSATYSYTRSFEGDPAPDQFSFLNGVEKAENLTRTPLDFLRWDVGRQYNEQGTPHHRLVANGIWEIGYGMQLSGVYLTTDGGYSTTSCGCQTGTGLSNRQRLDGTIIELNNFAKPVIQRLDMRFQKRFTLGHITLDGIFEGFNVMNFRNVTGYVLDESNPLFGTATSTSNNIAYQPRSLQVGFRVAF